jgi:hypothetical protein
MDLSLDTGHLPNTNLEGCPCNALNVSSDGETTNIYRIFMRKLQNAATWKTRKDMGGQYEFGLRKIGCKDEMERSDSGSCIVAGFEFRR